MTRVLEFGAPLCGSVQQSLAVHTKVAVISANLRVVVFQSYSHTHRLDHRSCNLSEVQQVSSNHRVNRQVTNNQDTTPCFHVHSCSKRAALRMFRGEPYVSQSYFCSSLILFCSPVKPSIFGSILPPHKVSIACIGTSQYRWSHDVYETWLQYVCIHVIFSSSLVLTAGLLRYGPSPSAYALPSWCMKPQWSPSSSLPC